MNKTEARFASYLEGKRHLGEISAWWFDAIKLKLGPRCTYSPDFMVQLPSGELVLYDVKGGGPIEEDARVKMRLTAWIWPFPLYVAREVPRKRGGGWDIKVAHDGMGDLREEGEAAS